jgi:uncharacterized protein
MTTNDFDIDRDAANDDGKPKIVFPCPRYPIKVVGDHGPELHAHVLTVFERHAPGYDETSITFRDSRHGRFQSITVFITAMGEAQLQNIFDDLKSSPLTKIVL